MLGEFGFGFGLNWGRFMGEVVAFVELTYVIVELEDTKM
jgi:hypothetical protein